VSIEGAKKSMYFFKKKTKKTPPIPRRAGHRLWWKADGSLYNIESL
jgi:hypothetical protein